MATLMEERFKEAQSKKESDIKSFIWKFPKENGLQNQIKMIDCSEEQLNSFYKHCDKMLFSDDVYNPGRKVVLKKISEQMNRCFAQEFVNKMNEEGIDAWGIVKSINDFNESNSGMYLFKDLFSTDGGYEQFKDIPLETIKNACIGKLGVFNNASLTKSFILKFRINIDSNSDKLLEQFCLDNKEIDSSNRIELVRNYLHLSQYSKVCLSRSGLNLTDIDLLLKSRGNRYEDLLPKQLLLLSRVALPKLKEDVVNHINNWETLKHQIESVATELGYKLI